MLPPAAPPLDVQLERAVAELEFAVEQLRFVWLINGLAAACLVLVLLLLSSTKRVRRALRL